MIQVGDKVKIAYEGYERYLNETGQVTGISGKFAYVKLDRPYPNQPWMNEPIISLDHLDKLSKGDDSGQT